MHVAAPAPMASRQRCHAPCVPHFPPFALTINHYAPLQSYLEGSLALPAEAAGRLVEAARLGLVPCSKSLLRTRYLQLKVGDNAG